MDFAVTPDPTDSERAAIAEALRELAEPEPSAYGSAWRRAALELAEDDYAAAPPRSSRGATRA